MERKFNKNEKVFCLQQELTIKAARFALVEGKWVVLYTCNETGEKEYLEKHLTTTPRGFDAAKENEKRRKEKEAAQKPPKKEEKKPVNTLSPKESTTTTQTIDPQVLKDFEAITGEPAPEGMTEVELLEKIQATLSAKENESTNNDEKSGNDVNEE